MSYADQTSVTICTLNEEDNIADCIQSVIENQPKEILVLDGGSNDSTVEVVSQYTDKVFMIPDTPLAFRRKLGVEKAKGKYVAMVDADQRLSKESLEKLAEELESHGYAGIQTQLLSLENNTYWEKGMEQNFKLSHNFPGPRIVIGTPALYRRSVLGHIGIDGSLTASCDDADWCYRLVCAGYSLGIGTQVAYQDHRNSFRDVIKKWRWYGKGDAQFFMKHPERRWSIFVHPLKNYILGRSIKTLQVHQPQFVPFFVICGIARHFGFWEAIIRMTIKYMIQGTSKDKDFMYRT